jgi:peptidoglycan/LPS O-acetylase OafA/YrhL
MNTDTLRHVRQAYRPDIDGLRAVAVCAVVGYHFFPFWISGGFVGVDIFYVISGRLIAGIILDDLNRNAFSFTEFYARRVRRIFPALAAVSAASLVFGWFALLPDEYAALGKHVFGGAGFLANFMFWSESGYFDTAAVLKPMLHLWSLGIEEQFYIFFPYFLYFCRKHQLRAISMIVLLLSASFLLNIILRVPQPIADFYCPATRFWELLTGAALAASYRYEPSAAQRIFRKADRLIAKIFREEAVPDDGRAAATALSLAGLLCIAVSVFALAEPKRFPGWQAVLPVAGTVLVLHAGESAFAGCNIPVNKFIAALGRISYPLYLWHWPLLSFAFIINGGKPERAVRIALAAVSLSLAFLTCRFLERPIRFGTRAVRTKTVVLCIFIAVTGLCGLSVFLRDGLPERASIARYGRVSEELTPMPSRDEAGFSYAGATRDSFIYCRYADAGSEVTVAVAGDSHAMSAYPGIVTLNEKAGRNTVLLGRFVPGESRENLKEMGERAIELMTRRRDITKVFLFFRGPVYMTGRHLYTANLNPNDVPHITPPEAFAGGLQDAVNRLHAAGKQVFIVSENPELTTSPREHIARPFRSAAPVPPQPKADMIKRQKEYMQLLHGITGATVVYSLDVFCPRDDCLVFDERGLPLYYDDDHLSGAGSDFQAERLLAPYLDDDGVR